MPSKPLPPSRPGMWTAITTAVEHGWGSTLRIMCIFALLGTIAVIVRLL